MLSGTALQEQLSAKIHVFAGTETIGELTILDALNKLIELYPTYPEPPSIVDGVRVPAADPVPASYDNTEEQRLALLRRRLRNIMAAESPAIKVLCDRAFELQMLLARGFPLNHADIITLEDFEKDEALIFLSSGTVISKASAENYFSKSHSRDNDGNYVDLNNTVLSSRELASLHAQQLKALSSYDEITPTSYYSHGKLFGRRLAYAITITAFVCLLWSGIFPPLLALPLCIITASALYASEDMESSSLMRMYGAAAGVTIFAALITVLFPPLAGLLAAASLISTGAAAAAVSFVMTVGTATILPALMFGVAALRRIFSPELSFHDALFKISNFPHVIITTVCVTLGGLIGKGIGYIKDYFNPPLPPQPVSLLVPADQGAPVVSLNSNALIHNSLGIDPSGPHPQSMEANEPRVEQEEHVTLCDTVSEMYDAPLEALSGNAFAIMRHF